MVGGHSSEATTKIEVGIERLRLAKYFHHEIVFDSQAHVPCLCSKQMAAIREDFANHGRAAILFAI